MRFFGYTVSIVSILRFEGTSSPLKFCPIIGTKCPKYGTVTVLYSELITGGFICFIYIFAKLIN